MVRPSGVQSYPAPNTKPDRKSTRLNSSHRTSSYAVFCLKKKIDHEKAVMLLSQRLSIFGSSNWTSPSTDTQREHNYFTTKPWGFDWLDAQFNRKWNNGAR